MRRFKIRQQADFLKRRNRHALRFLDEHDDLFALGMALEQMRVYQLHQFEVAGIARRFEVQLECHRMDDLFGRNARIGNVDGFDVGRQARLQHVAQHGFAAADLAGNLDDALALADRVDQRFEYGAAIAAAEKELGVRGDAERRLGESEVAVIHQLPCLRACRWRLRCHAATAICPALRPPSRSFACGCRASCGGYRAAWPPAKDCPA